jgi:hypothetical protein
MATIRELEDQGHKRIRLPWWTPSAYLELPDDGPWAHVHDPLSPPEGTPFLMGSVTAYSEWEPFAEAI